MKKLSLKVAVVVAFVAVAGYGVYSSQKSDKTMSELTLENLEALADNESGGGGTYDCCNTCEGAFCGWFTPADGSKEYEVYYR